MKSFQIGKKMHNSWFLQVQNKRRKICDDSKPLMKAVSTIAASISICKCNFNAANNIITAKQSSSNIPNVASLLSINSTEPPMNLSI